MRRPRLGVAALLTVLAAASTGAQAWTTYTVSIENFRFVPATLTLRRGDVIVWKNADFVTHNVTAQGGAFRSGDIGASASWKYAATRKGTFAYRCTFHPTMKATLVVD